MGLASATTLTRPQRHWLPRATCKEADRIAELEQKLHDPALFTRDAAAFGKTADALEKERASLTAMEEEWLELEMLREELQSPPSR